MNGLADNRESWELLKASGRIRVYKGHDAQGRPAVFKVYQLPSWLARRAFRRKQHKLDHFYRQQHSLPVPDLLTSGLSADGREGIFCYAWLPGQDLRRVDWKAVAEPEALSVMTQAGALLKDLHRQSWVHGDFKFGNLLHDQSRNRLYLLDVEALRRSRSTSRRARDLSRFLLNGLELSVPANWLQVFWARYQEGSGPVDRMHMNAQARHWLGKLGRRHRRRYGRSVRLDDLGFL